MYKIKEDLKQRIILEAKESKNEEAIKIIEEADDPVLWAERHLCHPDTGDFPFKAKKMFIPFLRSNKKDRALRVGRQCLAEGTFIHTRDGKIIPIEQHPMAWKTNDNAPVFCVTTDNGLSVIVTEEHPFLTNRGTIRCNKLKCCEDFLYTMMSWDVWPSGIIADPITGRSYEPSQTMMKMSGNYYATYSCNENVFGGKQSLQTRSMLHMVTHYCSYEQVCSFLAGFLSCVFTTIEDWNKKSFLCLTLTSNEECRILQQILFKIGVISTVNDTSITINDNSIFKLMEHIYVYVDNEEKDIVENIAKRYEEYKYDTSHYWLLGDDKEYMLQSKVVSIVPCGSAPVWDVTYPGKGWFCAQGIFVHNSGKTVHTIVDILHNVTFNPNKVVTVFVTSIPLMNRFLTLFTNMLRNSDLRDEFSTKQMSSKNKKSNIDIKFDHMIQVANGNQVLFFAMNKDPDKARGQFTTDSYLDECDYLPTKAFDVIVGMIKRDETIRLTASSTPSGLIDTWFHNFSNKCANPDYLDGEEFYLPTTLDEDWEIIEPRLRAIISDELTWRREVLAEFVEPTGAVYKRELIDAAFDRWRIQNVVPTLSSVLMTTEYINGLKFLGVDWNTPQNGVRLVELTMMFDNLFLTMNRSISYDDYTQVRAVKAIIDLMKEKRYAFVSVDAGYGATQLELLTMELPVYGFDPNQCLNVVDSNKTEDVVLEYTDTNGIVHKREIMKVRIKQRIISLVEKYLESKLAIPYEEEGTIGKELRNFRRKGIGGDRSFIYSEDCHSLSALQICLHGYERFMKERRLDQTLLTSYSSMSSAPIILGTKIYDSIDDSIVTIPIQSTSTRLRSMSNDPYKSQRGIYGRNGHRTKLFTK